MLNLGIETICFIIAKAREFQAKEEVVIPDPTGSGDDWALQVLADHQGDLTVQEVKATISDLDSDLQAELIALMWLGRGDYVLEEWDDALVYAQEEFEEHKATANYILANPMAGDYLEEGLIAHGYSCQD